MRVWRPAAGAPAADPLTGHDGGCDAVAGGTLPDGTPVIISGGDDRTVRVWRTAPAGPGRPAGPTAADPTDHQVIPGHDGAVRAVAAGALPRRYPGAVVGGGGDGTVRVWRLADGTPLREPLNLPVLVWDVAVRGDIIVTAAGTSIAVHQLANSHNPYESCSILSGNDPAGATG